jgi:hypothetical protein
LLGLTARELDKHFVGASESRSQFNGGHDLQNVIAVPSGASGGLIRAEPEGRHAVDPTALKEHVLFRLTYLCSWDPEFCLDGERRLQFDIQRARKEALAACRTKDFGETLDPRAPRADAGNHNARDTDQGRAFGEA